MPKDLKIYAISKISQFLNEYKCLKRGMIVMIQMRPPTKYTDDDQCKLYHKERH